MLRHPDYTRARIERLSERLRARIYRESKPIDELSVSPRVGRIRWAEAQHLAYRPAERGEQLGPLWATYWFRARARVPETWEGHRVDLVWISHSEATLWIDGRTVQGLSHHPSPRVESSVRPDAVLLERARGGDTIEMQIEVACNQMFGKPDIGHRPFETVSPFVLDRADIALFDPEAWKIYFDFAVLAELEAEQARAPGDLDRAWAGELLSELNRFANAFDETDRATWSGAHEILRGLYTRKNATRVHELSAIGHAHIDTAWLWPVAETYRKCERSFSSQVAYMDAYPEHKFACSQAQQYAWIKERNPDLWDRIVTKVRAGQWIPVGGTWVEPDCNIPSGESLARQLLYGQRFFERELGVRCHELWQPDVFGYNGQLPQLMRLAGMTRFLTQKLSWNRFNKPAHHTFVWQGVDGSEVLAHFPPADTYNAIASVAELRMSAREYKDHDRSRHALMLFGHGDGGGGPTKRMLEYLRRAEDLEGLPRTKIRSSDEFFSLLEEDCTDRPVVVGELYFEYHRGTYTSQAAVKRENRRSEELLHDVELASAWAHRLGALAYPAGEIERLWKVVLTNQFHDILPGSSIGEVYEDAARDYAEVRAAAEPLLDRACEALAGALAREGAGAATPMPVPLNTIGAARAEVAQLPDGSRVWIDAPPCGIGRVHRDAPDRVSIARTTVGSVVLENAHLRAEVSPDGTIASLVDKATGREALAAPGNVLELYDDRPIEFDAWDVDPFHLETRTECPPAESCTVVEEGPLCAEVAFERKIGKESATRQRVRLLAGGRRLEIEHHVDWQESHKLLKVAFPVDVRAMTATYEMQHGVAVRPTHFNTSYDLARFEVPGHRWVDLSEHGFGVALLSESKYGYSTLDAAMRISLLRAPASPDPRADRGSHRFAYAVMPHSGSWQAAGVVAEARRFNAKVVWMPHGADGAAGRSLASVDDPNLVLDTVKRAEDTDALVLRLYEAHGARGVARVRVGIPFERASQCNLLEIDDPTELERDGDAILVRYTPWRIVTIKLD